MKRNHNNFDNYRTERNFQGKYSINDHFRNSYNLPFQIPMPFPKLKKINTANPIQKNISWRRVPCLPEFPQYLRINILKSGLVLRFLLDKKMFFYDESFFNIKDIKKTIKNRRTESSCRPKEFKSAVLTTCSNLFPDKN